MNCEKNDLALIVKSACGHEGKIVTCLEFVPAAALLCPDSIVRIEPGWKISPPMLGWDGRLSDFIWDSRLRPIRDNDKEDESFRWAPSPTQKELA